VHVHEHLRGRRIRRALAASGSHPPYQPAARVRTSLAATRFRLYKRQGGRTGVPLRDDCDVGASFASGPADKEVAIEIVSADEHICGDARLLGYSVLDASGRPARTGAVVANGNWSVAQLLDRLASIAGIPRQVVAASKAPSSAASRTLTAAQLATLTWDDPTILACTKLSLRLTDGDTLVVRDRMHAAPAPLAATSPTSSAVRAPRAVGFATSGSATTAAEGFRPRRAAGVQIRGPQFDL